MSVLRNGMTTGTCAAAAVKAALEVLLGGNVPAAVEIGLPAGERISVPVLSAVKKGRGAEAAVVKDAGDDPDITDGVMVKAFVEWNADVITFCAGDGVGTVTKPGLSLSPGEPAVNPVPRQMITQSIRELTDRGIRVTLSIPGGRELSERTFNPRLGIRGGLSILGTSGRVRPFSCRALRASLRCCLDVLAATEVKFPVFVPGHIGKRAAQKHFKVTDDQIMEVSNEWGFVLNEVASAYFTGILILGHPGKLAKLANGDWDTHSSRSRSAVPFVYAMNKEIGGPSLPEQTTVEGIFATLNAREREVLGNQLAERIKLAVAARIGEQPEVSVILVSLKSEIIGKSGDMGKWLEKTP